MDLKLQVALLADRVESCGWSARREVTALCEKRGVEELFLGGRCKDGQEEEYLAILREIFDKWHTTNKFKPGDKVYVDPGKPADVFKNYVRATVTEICPRWGYHLRAFEKDLPGIYMFNIWDKDLIPRTDKRNKKLPDHYFK